MDRWLRPRAVTRCPLGRFAAWLAPWTVLLAVGVFAIWLCLYRGLWQTNMDNRFAFGLWIFLDLAVIALGAGAFFTGFLVYILRRRELAAVINSAVVIGFICYSGAILILMVDVGQPLRAWFTYWHPNVHSMLTEVTFCITCYLAVLAVEYTPLVLRQRQLRENPGAVALETRLHHVMPVLAAVGAGLSFFHQGSLGGLYGVLQGRPFSTTTTRPWARLGSRASASPMVAPGLIVSGVSKTVWAAFTLPMASATIVVGRSWGMIASPPRRATVSAIRRPEIAVMLATISGSGRPTPSVLVRSWTLAPFAYAVPVPSAFVFHPVNVHPGSE